jgi:hypothetical protein
MISVPAAGNRLGKNFPSVPAIKSVAADQVFACIIVAQEGFAGN